jgi:hypothetical protein
MKKKRREIQQKPNPTRPSALSVVPGGVGDNVVDGGQTAASIGLMSYHNRLRNKELNYEEETRTPR